MKRRIVFIMFTLVLLSANAQSKFKPIDLLIERGRYKKAEIMLLKLDPSFKRNFKLASLYDAIDNYRLASKYYKEALKYKDSYKTKVKLGKSLQKEKQPREAIKLYENILKEDKDNLLAKYTLGKLYLKIKKPKNAAKIFSELISADGKNARYHYQLGLANTVLRKKFKKVSNFLNAYKLDTTYFAAIEKLARAFTWLRKKDSAILFIEKGLELRPNHIDLNKLKINKLYTNKKYGKSIELLHHIDSLSPKEHYTNKMLAKSYYHLEDYKEAKKHFNTAAKIDPEDFKSHIYLGEIFLKEKNIKSAMYSFARATMLGKKKRDKVYMGLAKVYTLMKLPNRVIAEYKNAIEENRDNYIALFELAKVSDDYYKDKKIAYRLYEQYLGSFEGKAPKTDIFVKRRIKEIKKEHFLKGEILE